MENYQTDCLILGGGVAGLAIGSQLSNSFKDSILVEKNNMLGQETSSRNSEVIHAGIYYDYESLKAELCVSGKEYLYEYLNKKNIKHNRCGKFILSSNEKESETLFQLRENAIQCGVTDLSQKNKDIQEYHFLSFDEFLFSPSTGIFDSHSYMQALEADFSEQNGIVLLGNEVLDVFKEKDFFQVLIKDNNNDVTFYISSKIIINCLGVSSLAFSNKVHEDERYKLKLLKGEYYSYSGKEKLNHLIYPIPKKDSLGTHATIDLGNGIRFGPSAYEIDEVDYSINENEKESFLRSIRSYWPGVEETKLHPDYSGIRPLIEGEKDFVIEITDFENKVLVDVLGYASPGLTSSLATAKYVRHLLNEI